MSANPITPKPILRVWKVISRIGSTAYWLASITLSSMCTAVRTVRPSLAQSICGTALLSGDSSSGQNASGASHRSRTWTGRSSQGCRTRSATKAAHRRGLVAVISPTCRTGLFLLTSSRKIMPGSPFRHAP